MIAGLHPRREWRDNPGGQIRTIEEALRIAKGFGVEIPDELEFHVDDVSNDLGRDVTARAPRVDKASDEPVYWPDLVHDRTCKVPIRLWSGIMKSDEAIVAVIARETHEISCLRPYLEQGTMSIDDFIRQAEPGRPGNFHDRAWDFADRMVDRMRGEVPR
jgi:hypothetical protein